MASASNRLMLVICFFYIAINVAQAICVARKTSPSPSSPASQPTSSSDDSSTDSGSPSPTSSYSMFQTTNSYPPIYYPPNGQPSASPSQQSGSGSASSSDNDDIDPSSKASPSTESELSLGNNVAKPSSLFSSKVTTSSGNPEVKKICDATDNPALCLTSVTPLLVGGKVDPLSVLEVATKASMESAKMAVTAATKFGGSLAADADPDSVMGTCIASYKDALENLQQSIDAMATKDVGTVNTMLSAAITSFGDCADASTEPTSPMAAHNEKLKKMVSNCLAIATLVQ